MLYLIDCDIVYLCSHGSASFCIVLIMTVFICVLMVLPRVALDWLWHCLSVFLWFFLMFHWIDSDIVCLCSYGSSWFCIGFIVMLFFCVLMVLPNVALNWLWHCLSVFSWFFLMLHWIDCDIVNLCSHGSSSRCPGLILTLFNCVLVVLPHVAFVCDIVYLCSHGFSSCCIWLIVALFICLLMVLPHVALDWLWHCLSVLLWFFLMMHWIDCDIVYLWSYGPSSFWIGLIVTLFICVLIGLPHVALDWLWHCLSVISWSFLMLHWIDCDIVYLCSHGSSSCCIGLIVTLFICVPMVLPHVALDWLWHCSSVFLWFFLMMHCIDCDSVHLCSYCSSSCCIGLIVILLSVLSWFFLMLHWIDCDIVYLCSHGSSSCCIGLIVTLFICVLMVLPHDALYWLWQCLSVFLLFFLMLHWIDSDIVYLCSHDSSSCWIGLIVTLFICVFMGLPHVAFDWLWHCLSVFSWFFHVLH